MASKRRQLFQPLLFAGCLLALTVPLLQHQYRARVELIETVGPGQIPGLTQGPTIALIASLGGFRYVAADLLWLKADEAFESADWWEMVPLLQAVTALDPHFILAWKTLGWHQAWNLNVAETSAIGKQRRIEDGERSYKQAIAANPRNWELHWELTWLYYDREKEYHRALPWIEATARFKDAPSYVSRFKYRVYERTLEMPQLKAALLENMKLFPDEVLHQRMVHRDYEYWFVGWKKRELVNRHWVFVQKGPAATDPAEHKRNIDKTNAGRVNMGIAPYPYNDPYWDIDPKTGMAIPKKKGTGSRV